MAKYTLLQMTQNILSSMSSDEVNSISDSPESLQVANIIQNKYYDILTRGALPDDRELFQLQPSLDATKPVLMTVPATISKIEWIKYYDSNPADSINISTSSHLQHDLNLDLQPNVTQSWTTTSTTTQTVSVGMKTFTVATTGLNVIIGGQVQAVSGGTNILYGTLISYLGTTMVINVTAVIGSGTYSSWIISSEVTSAPGYRYVTIQSITDFLEMVNQFSLSEDNVLPYTFTEKGYNFTLKYKNDRQPQNCTILANQFVLFDSFDNTQDATLQGSKTQVYGQLFPVFSMTDSFIPELDDNQFPLLVNESKALAFFELKQMPHAKAEQEIKRQWSTVQKNKSVVNRPTYFDQLPSFGRQPRTGGYGGFIYGPKLWN